MLITPVQFTSPSESHEHSLSILDQLFEYDDFMMSVDSVCDIGCGSEGRDLEWWATRTTRDENPEPLNIKCTGVDLFESLSVANRYENITYRNNDFENTTIKNVYDILWCHDAFQYAINPIKTLSKLYKWLTPGGMLAISVPQTTNIIYNQTAYDQYDGQYYNYTLTSLIHMLAINGFDCHSGFFQKNLEDPWITAIVYKSDVKPMDPRTTRWYDLVDTNLLPESAVCSINKCGFLRQKDLILPWLDKSYTDFSKS